MNRLADFILAELPDHVARPVYDRRRVGPGIVHLGLGAFHRAHQAVYLDDLLASDPRWGIIGASLRSSDTRDALAPQDGLYTVAAQDGAGTSLRVIGSLLKMIAAITEADRERLLVAMSAPDIAIVGLTVTEKGYCHDPASGALDETHPDIVRDLATPHMPRSAPGFIVEALARRRASGAAPFTVLSCDNLPANGTTARRVVTRLAEMRDAALADHIGSDVAFPSSMVDRIVPATVDADRRRVSDALGLVDAAPVMTEPFSQWVVEDRFPSGRPALEAAGVELVGDVAPYEEMKLRMLNGSHSTLAYLGYLAGHETVADAIGAPGFRTLLRRLMTAEVIPTLAVPGTDLSKYRDRLLERFDNPALQHRTWQIAMDGSRKLPQRLLATIRDRLAADAGIAHLALGVAAWMRYVTGEDERGRAIDVRDPLAVRLRQVYDDHGPNADRLAPAYLAIREIFGDLGDDRRLHRAVTDALKRLLRLGAAATVATFGECHDT